MRELKDNPKANIASTLVEYHSSLHPRGNDPIGQYWCDANDVGDKLQLILKKGGAWKTFCLAMLCRKGLGRWHGLVIGGCHHICEDGINSAVCMDGVCRKCKLRNLIDEHGGFAAKDIPISLINMILCFMPANGCKIKRTADKGIVEGKIDPTSYRDKMVVQSLALGLIRECDEAGISRAKSWRGVIAILQPKPLICGIATLIIGVHDITFDQKPTILKCSWVK